MGHKRTRILIAAGGTGGHLFPAIAIADEIRKLDPHAEILFVGTRRKIESKVVPPKGYNFRPIWISGFHRGVRFTNMLFPLKMIVALVQSFFLIRKFRPGLVLGTGGYVSGPVLYVASMVGTPTVIHESNSYPGVTTRFLSGRVSKVLITFAETTKWLRRSDNVELVGNPTRETLGQISRELGAKAFNLDPQKRTLLVFGGSLGAASLNRAVIRMLPRLRNAGIQTIWQTGEHMLDSIINAEGIWIGKFIDKMEYAYAAADVVLCRAGATTLAELTRLGKPAILVPYPHAAADHQVKNAETLVEHGAARLIRDHELNEKAEHEILSLINNEGALRKMSSQSLKLGKPDAGREIAQKILNMVQA